jgi:hypothetical protein
MLLMSALGQKQTSRFEIAMSALPLIADISSAMRIKIRTELESDQPHHRISALKSKW